MPEAPAALPIHQQISELLVREIASGRLVEGERLPPERDFAQRLGTSVRTLRKALAELSEKGMLERVQGSGNYVRRNAQAESVYSMFRLELPEGGGLPRAEVLDLARMDKPADLPGFGTASDATRIRRLRRLNDTIIAIEEIWLDGAAGAIDPAKLADSLYLYYKTHLGFWITRAEDRVTIGEVPHWAPSAFTLRPGTITGYIERLSWAQGPAPVEFSRTWFDTARAHYVQRLI
ncbi:GntR family transcriptional regulator [Limimaricola soesokkakensis]|uniref:GntR family transcriptional regulator n=1 Tax=Limimaricola soesokkakensis TaxID=1343159 RepID=A0A1X6Z6A1_9RHOB|nr:GntR family transcriptional regulator [Limimaricola soesokkakensis]PSK86771.1 GntR family transcriptional regulator [Limimaricola soesokkakensis]SLN41633.1 HTH-type transcriptional repressor YvoA [Limimaricola soesokkakensis]